MADVRKIRVMISSRSMTPVFTDRSPLSDVRERLQSFLHGIRWYAEQPDARLARQRLRRVGRDQALFDVWIHEREPGKGSDRSTLEISLSEINKADVVIVLYTGEAGSATSDRDIGICHAEMRDALARRPEIVSLIGLLPLQENGSTRDVAFRTFVTRQSLYRKDVSSEAALQAAVAELLQERVAALVARGASIGVRKRDRGQALDWNRLDIAARQAEMRKSLALHLGARPVGPERDADTLHVVSMPDGQLVGVRIDAIAAASSTAAARERVGQPFLREHLYASVLQFENVAGVVHVIACNRGITEAQATRTLGTPDAICVTSDFGAYVADHVQRTQLVFLAQCADDTATALAVRRFNEWLVQSGEGARIVQRAWSRRRIVDVMAAEQPERTTSPEFTTPEGQRGIEPDDDENMIGGASDPTEVSLPKGTIPVATNTVLHISGNPVVPGKTAPPIPEIGRNSFLHRFGDRVRGLLQRHVALDQSTISPSLPATLLPERGSDGARLVAPLNVNLGPGTSLAEPETANETVERAHAEYDLPPAALLDVPQIHAGISEAEQMETARQIEERLREYGAECSVVHIDPGPVITTYELQSHAGVTYRQVTEVADTLGRAMQLESVLVDRVPGKSTVAIQIPNPNRETISLHELLESDTYRRSISKLTLALGKTIHGDPYVTDLAAMPHLLIAGSTGTGKSVSLNAMITSILYRATPDDVRLIMIDPKRLELGMYENIPHLLAPVIVDPKKASNALRWAVREMEERYKRLAGEGVRDIEKYNRNVRLTLEGRASNSTEPPRPMPFIVVVIDELADLMAVASNDVEESIARLAQMARAVGIHLIVATQRSSADVITGLIKTNLPSRISFRVSSRTDSRTILDGNGAEQLLGRGDMLFLPPASARCIRLHGPYVSEQESIRLATFLRKQGRPIYDDFVTVEEDQGRPQALEFERDDLYDEAARMVVGSGQTSISYLQRRLRIGFSRAARLIDMMEAEGLVSAGAGGRPREVLVPKTHFE